MTLKLATQAPAEVFVEYNGIRISRAEVARTLLRAELEPGLSVERASYANTLKLAEDEVVPVLERTAGRVSLLRAGLRYVDPGEPHFPYIELMDEQRFLKVFPDFDVLLPVLRTFAGVQPYAKDPIREKTPKRPTLVLLAGALRESK